VTATGWFEMFGKRIRISPIKIDRQNHGRSVPPKGKEKLSSRLDKKDCFCPIDKTIYK
jgi:hypothetical protein